MTDRTVVQENKTKLSPTVFLWRQSKRNTAADMGKLNCPAADKRNEAQP